MVPTSYAHERVVLFAEGGQWSMGGLPRSWVVCGAGSQMGSTQGLDRSVVLGTSSF